MPKRTAVAPGSAAFDKAVAAAADELAGRDPVIAGLVAGDVTPERVLALSEEELRAPGLSGAKARCIRALAGRAASGALPLEDLDDLPDDEIVAALSAVPGIGRWTAEMFLLFQLGRLDVWPVGDYGVRKGYAVAYGLPETPTPKALTALGEPFRPYRSVAAWYCWRAAETVTPGAGRA